MDNGGVICRAQETCVGCGSDGIRVHEGLRDHEFGAPGTWSNRRCSNDTCGLSWLDPQPRPDQIGKLYASYWTHGGGDDAVPTPNDFGSRGAKKLAKHALAALFFWRRRAFLTDNRFLGDLPPGRMIDVGCGMGEFVAGMAEKGWDAQGIDFDEKAIACARRYPHATFGVGDLIGQAFPDAHFDAITMSNVIEHIPDPVETFAECARVLRPGGRLVMITPNVDALGHGIFGADWRGLEPPRHLFLYTPRALRSLAERAGFARTELICSPGDRYAANYIVTASQEIARKAGRVPPPVSVSRLMMKERLLDTVGVLKGEWVSLIAHR